MTTEIELDVNKIVDSIENNEIPPESSQLTIPPAEETVLSKTDEQVPVETPKRAGRKKRDTTVTSNVKNESFNHDNAMDTQPLFEQPVIVEGKRSRKPTPRLELSDLDTPKKELSIPQGQGKPLGEIEYIDYQITHASTDVLSRMRNICFGRRAGKMNIQQSLRDFNGFEFEQNTDEYQRHLSNLTKLKKDQLQSVSDILGLPATGRNDEHAERILHFLMKPVDEGKPIPERKMSMRTLKKPSINLKESVHSDDEENEAENGGDDDDDDDNFNADEDEEEEEAETDDDYIGSDEESGLITKDDPDDFVYQPGKKTPKKRPSIKRSRSRTSHKRARGASTSKRGRKKSKITRMKTTKVEKVTAPTESMQTNNEDIDRPTEETSANDNIVTESKDTDLNPSDVQLSTQNDTTTNDTSTDVIPATNTN